jgi:hypothetical protein
MATRNVLDDLNGLLTDEEKVALAKVLNNAAAKAKLETGLTFASYYDNPEVETPATPVTPVSAAPPARPAVPPPVVTAPVTTPTSVGASLDDIGKLLDSKLEGMRKEFVPAADLAKYRSEILTSTIRSAHEVARVESTHEKEFGEPLDLDKLNEYADEQAKKGTRYGSITKAYDDWVGQRRIEKKIADGIAEGVKQKTSSTSTPAVSSAPALSPAQELMRKAKGEGDGSKTNAQRAAERLRQMERGRDAGEAA